MNYYQSRRIFELVILSGLSLWISIAWFNNLTDQDTNITHLKNMISMNLLQDTSFGHGLLWRKWNERHATFLIYFIVFIQFIVSIFMWKGVASLIKVIKVYNLELFIKSRRDINLSLILFMSIWIFFLCGGLWFGYWIKQGMIQNVHMILLLISICSFITINLPEYDNF